MKYRQRGYREDDYEEGKGKRKARREPKPDLGNREQVRSLRHAIDRNVTLVLRCGRCGFQVPINQLEVDRQTTCSKCKTPFHSCRHCSNFDGGARWSCRASIEARVVDKWAANECSHFKPSQVLDATGRRADTTEDAREAFHNLFKS